MAPSSAAVSALSAKTKPVGPQELCPGPKPPRAARKRTASPTAGLANSPPPWDGPEMAADLGLELGNAGSEGGLIGFGDGRQDAHQHQMTEIGGARLGEARQIAKGLQLGLAMDALAMIVEDQQHAPAGGKFEPRHQRRQAARLVAAAIHHQAAFLENADADAGTGAAVEEKGIIARLERQAVHRPQRGGDGERQLGSRSQAGMGRNRLVHHQLMAVGDAEMPAHDREIADGTLGFGTLECGVRRRHAASGW